MKIKMKLELAILFVEMFVGIVAVVLIGTFIGWLPALAIAALCVIGTSIYIVWSEA
jgi:hypothetical protein